MEQNVALVKLESRDRGPKPIQRATSERWAPWHRARDVGAHDSRGRYWRHKNAAGAVRARSTTTGSAADAVVLHARLLRAAGDNRAIPCCQWQTRQHSRGVWC